MKLSGNPRCRPGLARFFIVLLGAILGAAAFTATATSASAVGSCSIRVPSTVAIASHTTVITAYPGSDCAASGMSFATWDVSPSAFGDSFLFETGSLNSTYTFYSSLDNVGLMHAVPTGASSTYGYNDLAQNSPAFVIKYATWAYSAHTRKGVAVYIHGLAEQWSSNDLAAGAGRTIYLQRYLRGAWQTILARTTTSTGQLTVGFIQTNVFQYRWVVPATGSAWGAYSASTIV